MLTIAPLFIEPGSPWENGYVESFNGQLRDEWLNGELFYTLHEAQVLVERWRRQYNPHRARIVTGVSATGPRNPHGHTDWLVGMSELIRWPNSWRQITSLAGIRARDRRHFSIIADRGRQDDGRSLIGVDWH